MCYLPICVPVLGLGLFFFKQKTAYDMRISDWSSDVCSSDLRLPRPRRGRGRLREREALSQRPAARALPRAARGGREIGRASCRERVWQYVLISVVCVTLKKTTEYNGGIMSNRREYKQRIKRRIVTRIVT